MVGRVGWICLAR